MIEIYKLYFNELYNYGMRISHNEELTRDCIQDLFAKLWAGDSKIIDAKEPKTYMFKVLRNNIIDALKQNAVFIEEHDTELYDPILAGEDLVLNKELTEERSEQLKQAIEQLSNRQKEIIYLRFYNGLSYEEIAEVTSIKYQSIRNIFSSSLKILRKKLLMIGIVILFS